MVCVFPIYILINLNVFLFLDLPLYKTKFIKNVHSYLHREIGVGMDDQEFQV